VKVKFIDGAKISNKRVLLRVDFNVPVTPNGKIADDSRIRETVDTVKYLLDSKNKVIIASHLGRPEKRNSQDSLEKVGRKLYTYLHGYKWHFVPDFLTDIKALEKQKEGEFALLDNIRFYPGEASNDDAFAEKLAELADVYVNDAFAVSHRKAASVVAITKYLPSYGGLLLKKEITMLSKITEKPAKPMIAILSGKKISTKIKFISKLAQLADSILLAGGLANTFLAGKGYEIGKSIYVKEEIAQAKALTSLATKHGATIVLPEDVIVGKDPDGVRSEVKMANAVSRNDFILDIGPKTQALYQTHISTAKTIVWNGPTGYFENPVFRRGTDFIYYAILQNPKAISVAGGGDTIAAIADHEDLDKITHISTGGGAMLAFVEEGTLVGIEALKNSSQ
jgi:phosphoglycerate kinase